MEKKTTSALSSEQRVKELEQELAKAHADLSDANAALESFHDDEIKRSSVNISSCALRDALNAAELLRTNIMSWHTGDDLTEADRRRLLGSGVRRYGFLDKVSDIMTTNPQFTPSFLDEEGFKEQIRNLEEVRNISVILQQTLRANNDVLAILGDQAFRMALMYYGAVRDASLRRVQGASALFRILQQFFRHGRPQSEEPTEHEVERDVKALLHGHKDGKIVIENERPHMVGGKHVVVDETHKERAAFKETESGEI